MSTENRKYLVKGNNSCPHIGEMVAKHLKATKTSKAAVARKIDVSPSVVKAYVKQPSIQTAILWRVGAAVGHHFLAELTMAFSKTYPAIANPLLDKELQEKDNRIAALEAELKIYKEIVQAKMGTGG